MLRRRRRGPRASGSGYRGGAARARAPQAGLRRPCRRLGRARAGPVAPGAAPSIVARSGRSFFGRAGLEAQILVVQPVAELVALRLEVARFSGFGAVSIGTCSTTVRPKPSMPVIFFGLFVRMRIVVRPRSARIWLPIPYSRASAGKPELEVRLDGVEPLLLQLVGLELVQQADAAPLLRHVEEHAALLLRRSARAPARAARRSRSAASGRRRRSGIRSARGRARSRRRRPRRSRARRGACRSASRGRRPP